MSLALVNHIIPLFFLCNFNPNTEEFSIGLAQLALTVDHISVSNLSGYWRIP